MLYINTTLMTHGTAWPIEGGVRVRRHGIGVGSGSLGGLFCCLLV